MQVDYVRQSIAITFNSSAENRTYLESLFNFLKINQDLRTSLFIFLTMALQVTQENNNSNKHYKHYDNNTL